MPVAASFKSNSNSTSAQNFTEEPDFIIDCVPNFNGIEQLFYVFAFTRVIFFLVPMITGNFSKFLAITIRFLGYLFGHPKISGTILCETNYILSH